jgi:hypothetical protein
MGLLSAIEDRLGALLDPILRPIKPLVQLVTQFRESTVGIFDALTELVNSAIEEYEQIKNLKTNPAWKNRVISVPHVIENIQALVAIPHEVATAVRDLVNQVKGKLNIETFNLDELEGIEDLRGIFTKLGGRLAAGLEKVLGWAALIIDALVTIRASITDLQTIVDSIRTVREDIENLDLIFLPQKNPRKPLETVDGDIFKIRVGSLHPSA